MQKTPVLAKQVLNPASPLSASTITALTLDLDDTLWPILPVIDRCEQVLARFLDTHAPLVAQRYPRRAMRELRDAVSAERPDLGHDYGAVRRLSLQRAFEHCAIDDPDLIEQAYAVFYATRNEVELYDEVATVLPMLAARYPLLALTNGNADIQRIGVHRHFLGAVFAREVGCGKPDPRIFAHACERLGLAAEQILHVGDDPELDVLGAHRAGLRSAWLNRDRRPWPFPDGPQPDLIVHDLTSLDTWLSNDQKPEAENVRTASIAAAALGTRSDTNPCEWKR